MRLIWKDEEAALWLATLVKYFTVAVRMDIKGSHTPLSNRLVSLNWTKICKEKYK